VGGLPCGKWAFNANGLAGILDIHDVDKEGAVNGSLNFYPINGSWDGESKRITFLETISRNRSLSYDGFLNNACIAGQIGGRPTNPQECYILAGFFAPTQRPIGSNLTKNSQSVNDLLTEPKPGSSDLSKSGWIGIYLGIR
jgi:hypothetical protein